ncbi:MAG: phenylacetate-CoA oxygenase/reductase subunit PaaK, partial [Candidatus Eremiobacteraeota bacterium]|nr:phenylacetate-CoA oxygenase/reductase subunit PaaK [Candidatus Eremiobacteraeota bacterium]
MSSVTETRGFHALTVSSVRRDTRDAIVVTFAVPPELRERFRFAHGQYLTLRTSEGGEELRRSYSICSGAHDGDLRVAIKRVGGGRFSSWAHDALVPGALVEVAPPEGRFGVPLDAANAHHYLGFAAGSGITPLLSIVKTTLATEPRSRFTLVYANRASSTVMFREELQDLKDRYLGRLVLLFVMSREPQDVELFSGRLDREKCDALLESWIDASTVHTAFVCGPEEMTRAASESLAAHGIAPDRIKTELFVAAPRGTTTFVPRTAVDDRPTCEAYAILDGQRRFFTIEKGKETVLDAGLRQGIDLPYSCKGGVCSTCRVRLVEGEVDMDVRYALEDYEIARGFVLMCQSYPVTDRIGLDVDDREFG